MSTITAILEPDADGTLHLPLPAELRSGRVRVTATLEATSETAEKPSRESAVLALQELRDRGTFKEISDPIAWQREMRRDRPLPERS